MNGDHVSRLGIVALVVASAVACGGGDGIEAEGLLGIYEITAWTHNEADCAQEGPSVLTQNSETHFILTRESVFGTEFLAFTLCTGLSDCAEKAESGATLAGYGLTTGDANTGFEGAGASAGTNFETGACQGEARDFQLRALAAESLNLRIETTVVADFPTGDENVCWTDDAREAAKDLPCTSLESISGALVEAR